MADNAAVPYGELSQSPTGGPARLVLSPERATLIVGVIGSLVLAVLAGWLGFRGYQADDADAQRDRFVAAGRQEAVNLTTIGYQHAEADVQRVLDSATGSFYDSFSGRSHSLIDSVTQQRSTAVGTATEAGLESETGDGAQVLVAVSVQSTHLGGLDKPPRQLRMRVVVQQVGNELKTSDVELVP